MPLITFDDPTPAGYDFEDLKASSLPDEIECGENNKFWVKVWRRAKVMVLIDKETGKILKKAEIIQPAFDRIAASYGVGPRQIMVVKAALELK